MISLQNGSPRRLISDEEYLSEQLRWSNEIEGSLDEVDGYNCIICKNKGYLYRIEGDSIVASKCLCMTTRKSIRLLRKSGLSNSIKSFDDFETNKSWQAELKKKAMLFAGNNNKQTCFFVGGQSGAGKTHICSAIAKAFIEKGIETRYVIWVSTIEKLTNYNDPDRIDLMENLSTVKVLYIDDFLKPLGKEKSYTSREIQKTFDLIDRRYKIGDVITIISSELGIDDVNRIDQALAGRIVEMASRDFVITIAKNPDNNYRYNF